MGYSTTFKGGIKPNRELKASEIAYIQELFKFNPRGGDYSKSSPFEFYYIDLEFNDNFTSFGWNGSEKSYGMRQQVQYVIDETIKKFPDIIFNGEFTAQGEEYDDKWKLIVEDNKSKEIQIVLKGKKVECPHCGEEFRLEEEN